MEILIEKLDNEGNGLSHIDGKIIFISKCLEGELVDIDIIKETKKYYVGKLNKVIIPSKKRIDPLCKHFNKCGGCNLLNLEYKDTLEYKENKIKEIFKKYLNYNLNVNVIESGNKLNYRNKLILHIENNKLGLIDENNKVFNIDECYLVNKSINNIIGYIKSLNINNGKVQIRSNDKDELLISIDTKDKIDLKNINDNIKGIILNNKVIYGEDYFIETINNLKFKVSYNSFFQINRDINSKLFNIINDNINNNDKVLDLYCGVGSIGINASLKANKVLGIDNLESNIKDANDNKKLNNIKNIEFIYGDASIFPKYIDKDIDTIIVDPPRNGLNKFTLKNILEYKPKKLIYVSCDPFTLVRDLKELMNIYNINKYYLLDMFPYTHHIESVIFLERK